MIVPKWLRMLRCLYWLFLFITKAGAASGQKHATVISGLTRKLCLRWIGLPRQAQASNTVTVSSIPSSEFLFFSHSWNRNFESSHK